MEQKGRAELLLAGLRMRVQDAPSTALNADKAVLDRQELLKLIDNVAEVVRNELKTYRETTDKRARIIQEAKEEAEEILYQAERTASRIRVTKRRADEPPSFRSADLSPPGEKGQSGAGVALAVGAAGPPGAGCWGAASPLPLNRRKGPREVITSAAARMA